ncbi:MAG: type IV pilin N-terminal domain-containing protein [Archaeoglobaceae archaeon]|nr:type IV pilin N-terminal domain-containing protein [Archaeoglobaceae archaeon]MDW8128282.1 type IV pilin N-terminal domain-containing protein [Archaeoglobaceae archaeon]
MNGVSSVVGVLLTVAITVLLSVILASMSFGFASNKSLHLVAFSLSKSTETEFSIALVGGEVEKIENCRAYKNSQLIGYFNRNEIGKSISFQASSGDRVRVVCAFSDRSESIVFERLI